MVDFLGDLWKEWDRKGVCRFLISCLEVSCVLLGVKILEFSLGCIALRKIEMGVWNKGLGRSLEPCKWFGVVKNIGLAFWAWRTRGVSNGIWAMSYSLVAPHMPWAVPHDGLCVQECMCAPWWNPSYQHSLSWCYLELPLFDGRVGALGAHE